MSVRGDEIRHESVGWVGVSIACSWCHSRRRTLGITVRPDKSVTVRVPLRASIKEILELRVCDYQPGLPPNMDMLALLCQRCREWADGRKADPKELRSIRNALWSNIPAVAKGATRVLAQCKEPWARGAIDESFIDDLVKAKLLK